MTKTIEQILRSRARVLWSAGGSFGRVGLALFHGGERAGERELLNAVDKKLDSKWVMLMEHEGVRYLAISQPRDGSFGGPALREQILNLTRRVRDAAKAEAREAGYSVR